MSISLTLTAFTSLSATWVLIPLQPFYHAFPPEEALRIMRKLVFHYTPKHASWLNRVEIDLSILVKHCLTRRLPDRDTLRSQVDAWQQPRIVAHATVHWHFDVDAARSKLKRLYP